MLKNNILPRLIRLKHAPAYVGMDVIYFNRNVRPHVTEIKIGKRGVAFDRLDLDQWVEYHKSGSGRPLTNRSKKLWDVNEPLGCIKGMGSGVSIKRYTDKDFVKALERATLKKQKKC